MNPMVFFVIIMRGFSLGDLLFGSISPPFEGLFDVFQVCFVPIPKWFIFGSFLSIMWSVMIFIFMMLNGVFSGFQKYDTNGRYCSREQVGRKNGYGLHSTG